MAMSLAASALCTPTVAVLGSKRASATRRGLAVSKPSARVARRNVTTRAIQEVGQADFKAEVLEVSKTIPTPLLTARSSDETETNIVVREELSLLHPTLIQPSRTRSIYLCVVFFGFVFFFIAPSALLDRRADPSFDHLPLPLSHPLPPPREMMNQSDVPVLVDFWATWCGPCKLISKVVEKAEAEYPAEQLKIVKIEVDPNPELVEEYGVYGLPTIALFKDGKMVDGSKREGAINLPKLKDHLQTLGISSP